MKKFVFRFLITVISCLLLLVSCSTKNLGVYDKSVPADQMCTLEISGGINVFEFNGKELNRHWVVSHDQNIWGDRGWISDNKVIIQIPAGFNTLGVFFQMDDRSTMVTTEKTTISGDFIAGRTYVLKAQVRVLPSGRIYTRYHNNPAPWQNDIITLVPGLFNIAGYIIEEK
ncbi:MAG: hypothetical protein FWD13_03505 [Treponema sp.]|nr:hypothetical protein [Treponema sp.]